MGARTAWRENELEESQGGNPQGGRTCWDTVKAPSKSKGIDLERCEYCGKYCWSTSFPIHVEKCKSNHEIRAALAQLGKYKEEEDMQNAKKPGRTGWDKVES